MAVDSIMKSKVASFEGCILSFTAWILHVFLNLKISTSTYMALMIHVCTDRKMLLHSVLTMVYLDIGWSNIVLTFIFPNFSVSVWSIKQQ